jgi:hypothetical protein
VGVGWVMASSCPILIHIAVSVGNHMCLRETRSGKCKYPYLRFVTVPHWDRAVTSSGRMDEGMCRCCHAGEPFDRLPRSFVCILRFFRMYLGAQQRPI